MIRHGTGQKEKNTVGSLQLFRFLEHKGLDELFSSRFVQVLIPTLFILAFAIVYTSHITRWLFGDEAFTALKFSETPYHALFLYTEPNNHLLHSLFVWFSKSIFGNNLIGIRFTTFASALLSLAMIFRLGKRIGGYKLGLVALVLLGINHSFVEYSINARGYTLTVLLTLVLLERCLFILLPLKRSLHYSILLSVWALVLVLPTNIFVVAALTLWLIQQRISNPQKTEQLALIMPLIFGTLLAAIFYIFPLLTGLIGEHVARFGLTSITQLLSDLLSLYFQNTLLNILIAILVLVGLVLVMRQENHGFRSIFLSMLFTCIAASLAALVVLHKLPFARNYIFLFPFVALLGAKALSYLPHFGLTILCIIIAILGLMEAKPVGNEFMEKWFPIMTEGIKDSDILVVGCCEYEPFYYHFSAQGEPKMFEYDDSKTRIVFLPARQTVEYLIDFYQLEDRLSNCTFETWSSEQVYVCNIVK